MVILIVFFAVTKRITIAGVQRQAVIGRLSHRTSRFFGLAMAMAMRETAVGRE